MRFAPARHGRTHQRWGSDPIPQELGEFISLEQEIVGLNGDGTSTSGTDAAGIVFFTSGTQRTNIGGAYAEHTPPIDLTGSELSFDDGASDQISLKVPGWYVVQRQYLVLEVGGVSPAFFVSMSGDQNALGFGGGRPMYASGDFNEVNVETTQILYMDGTTFATPYAMNTSLSHTSGTSHDVTFRISVGYLGQ